MIDNPEKQIIKEAPYNSKAEQAVLGSFLINNEQINKVSDFLIADHFYVPIHKKIYEGILKFQEKGLVANPITLKNYFNAEVSLQELGVDSYEYLIKLSTAASPITSVESLAKVIYDLALRRGLIELAEETLQHAYNEDFNISATDMIESTEQNLFNLASSGNSESNLLSIRDSLFASLSNINELKKRGGKVNGIPSGYTQLDKILGGLQTSDLLILAARPSMGKTSLAVNIAINAAEQLHKNAITNKQKPLSVGIFSLEMSSDQITNRILAIKTGIDGSKIRNGMVSKEEFIMLSEACSKINDIPLYIDDTPAISISALRTRARRLKRVHNVGMILVDYLQLIRGSFIGGNNNRVQEIGEITQGLKAIAKELNIPVIALSQLSRAVESRENKRPLLSDLRESGNIEQDADVVMFIYRAEYYLEREIPDEGEKHREWEENREKMKNIAEVIIAKQRNGPTGSVSLYFNKATTGFSNLENDVDWSDQD
jgi:replicative DNA helicase